MPGKGLATKKQPHLLLQSKDSILKNKEELKKKVNNEHHVTVLPWMGPMWHWCGEKRKTIQKVVKLESV